MAVKDQTKQGRPRYKVQAKRKARATQGARAQGSAGKDSDSIKKIGQYQREKSPKADSDLMKEAIKIAKERGFLDGKKITSIVEKNKRTKQFKTVQQNKVQAACRWLRRGTLNDLRKQRGLAPRKIDESAKLEFDSEKAARAYLESIVEQG